jgi:hypothetical protein
VRAVAVAQVTYFQRPQNAQDILSLLSSMLVRGYRPGARCGSDRRGAGCSLARGRRTACRGCARWCREQGFSDDEKVQVGLIKRGVFSTLLRAVSPSAAGSAARADEGNSLADAWVQFLMEQSGSPGPDVGDARGAAPTEPVSLLGILSPPPASK